MMIGSVPSKMRSDNATDIRNRLLRALPPASFELVASCLERVVLPVNHVLVEADAPTVFVHFLDHGAAVMATVDPDGFKMAEVGHIGREGMSGFHVLHGVEVSPHRTTVHVPSAGHRLAVSTLNALCDDDPDLRRHLLRYVHTYETQLAQTALANARFGIQQRLARWILMSHDRLESDDLPLTHEFLSLVLGVRRAGVTNELHVLEGMGLIKALRALIRIRDRAGLERVAGSAYGLSEREYERLIARLPCPVVV